MALQRLLISTSSIHLNLKIVLKADTIANDTIDFHSSYLFANFFFLSLFLFQNKCLSPGQTKLAIPHQHFSYYFYIGIFLLFSLEKKILCLARQNCQLQTHFIFYI